jgi:hypothetical protein
MHYLREIHHDKSYSQIDLTRWRGKEEKNMFETSICMNFILSHFYLNILLRGSGCLIGGVHSNLMGKISKHYYFYYFLNLKFSKKVN